MIKRALSGVLALAVAGAVAAGSTASASTPTRTGGDDRLREVMRRLTTVDGGVGALTEIRDGRGRKVLTSGVADVASHAPVRGDSTFRIGSMTKTFVATTVLQLVGEHRVALDAPIERYLPGVVRGHGNDGRKITVRELLQHTSALPDYLDYLSVQEVLAHPLAHYDARDLVRLALAHPPTAKEPGTEWRYISTDYLLAGMLIKKVTGYSYRTEIGRRIIKPLGLHQTYVPGDSPVIPGPHPHGYARPDKDGPVKDYTAVNPTVAGASGSMISSGTDLNRFFGALLDGTLLRPAQLRQMMKTRPTGGPDGEAYGLGLESKRLPCGGLYWWHDGGIPGFQTLGGATTDGRQATTMVSLYPGESDAQDNDVTAAVQTALCEARPAH